jgi:cell pole-organizing protein PopZ
MPDPTLSSDMAEELLAPATNAAIQGTMGKLSALTAVGTGQTLDGMMRDMLRPMLKEWLDENLPAVVERVVEREISRISRGVK